MSNKRKATNNNNISDKDRESIKRVKKLEKLIAKSRKEIKIMEEQMIKEKKDVEKRCEGMRLFYIVIVEKHSLTALSEKLIDNNVYTTFDKAENARISLNKPYTYVRIQESGPSYDIIENIIQKESAPFNFDPPSQTINVTKTNTN